MARHTRGGRGRTSPLFLHALPRPTADVRHHESLGLMFTLDWRRESSRGLSASDDDRPRYAHPIVLMASVKAIGILVLTLWSSPNGKSAHVLLSARWDSLWYARVAEHGYSFTSTAPDGRVLSNQAFFPLFPAFEKGFAQLLHLSPADAGLLISATSSLFAGAGIYRLVGMFTDHRTALLTVALWATTPVSIVQSMAYSESLFTAIAAWALCFALQEKWVPAGVLACAAGLTRPVGISVGPAVWSAVAISVRREGWSAPKAISTRSLPRRFHLLHHVGGGLKRHPIRLLGHPVGMGQRI